MLVQSEFEPSTSRTLVRCTTTEPKSFVKYVCGSETPQATSAPGGQRRDSERRTKEERAWGGILCLQSLFFLQIRGEERKEERNTSKRWAVSVWAWYAKAVAASSTGVGRQTKCLPALTHAHLFWFLPHGFGPSKIETPRSLRTIRHSKGLKKAM